MESRPKYLVPLPNDLDEAHRMVETIVSQFGANSVRSPLKGEVSRIIEDYSNICENNKEKKRILIILIGLYDNNKLLFHEYWMSKSQMFMQMGDILIQLNAEPEQCIRCYEDSIEEVKKFIFNDHKEIKDRELALKYVEQEKVTGDYALRGLIGIYRKLKEFDKPVDYVKTLINFFKEEMPDLQKELDKVEEEKTEHIRLKMETQNAGERKKMMKLLSPPVNKYEVKSAEDKEDGYLRLI